MKHFRLVNFFLHVKPDLLILVSGYGKFLSFVNFFLNVFYFITFSQCSSLKCCSFLLKFFPSSLIISWPLMLWKKLRFSLVSNISVWNCCRLHLDRNTCNGSDLLPFYSQGQKTFSDRYDIFLQLRVLFVTHQ